MRWFAASLVPRIGRPLIRHSVDLHSPDRGNFRVVDPEFFGV
jgi:hypothetical protein